MTIINNELVADETKLRLFSPIFYVPDPDISQALGLASLYFGQEGKEPANNPDERKQVYALQEDGSAVAISQPIKTTIGGVAEYNGSPVNLAVDGGYSFEALSSGGSQKYYYPSILNPTFLSSGITSIKEDAVIVVPGQTTVTFPNIDVSQALIDVSGTNLADPSVVDSRPLFREVDYVVSDGGSGVITLLVTPFPTGTILRATQNISTAESGELADILTVLTQPNVAAAIAVNFAVGDTVKILSDSASDDGLTNDYEVIAANTSPVDGVNIIRLNNNLQFRLIKTRNKFQAYTEALGVASVLSGVLTVDMNNGPVQEVTLTENVSSFIFGNVSSDGVTTVQLKIKQDATGSRSVGFTGFISAGGSAPAISTGANEEDIFVFQTFDAGATWYLFTSGINMGAI